MVYRFPEIKEKSLIGRAWQIIDPLSGGKSVDDTPFSVRLMMRTILTVYGQVLREDFMLRQDRGETVNPQMYVDYNCENLEVVKDCRDCKNGTNLKRFAIPKLAQFGGNPLIRFVGTENLTFTPVSGLTEALSLSKDMAYNPGRPGYYISGDYVYVSLPGRYAMVRTANYSIVPEDPSSEACFNVWSEDFPMDDYLWSIVSQRIKTGEGNIYLTTMPGMDRTNNGRPGNNVE